MDSFTHRHQNLFGFIVLEVLLAVTIISILASIVLIAINPTKNLSIARNTRRSADVNIILNAIYQYYFDTTTLPFAGGGTGITPVPTDICVTHAASCIGFVDLSPMTASGKYLITIPTDPLCPTACLPNSTGYVISQDANGRLTVTAAHAENGKAISVSK